MNLKTMGIAAAVIALLALGYSMIADGDVDIEDRAGPPEAFQQNEE